MRIRATRNDGFIATLDFAWPISTHDSAYIARFSECYGGARENWIIVDRMVDAGAEEKAVGLIGAGNYRKIKDVGIKVIDKSKYDAIIEKWKADIESNGEDYNSVTIAIMTELINDFESL